MGLRYRPMTFTEQGIAMLSSVLRSNRAILELEDDSKIGDNRERQN